MREQLTINGLISYCIVVGDGAVYSSVYDSICVNTQLFLDQLEKIEKKTTVPMVQNLLQ